MRFKAAKSPPLDREGAEAMAASALAFLAADPDRLARFMTETGMDPQALASGLKDGGAGVIEAALDHIAADESLLLVFASEVRRKPDEIMLAQYLLSGAPE
jgi:hypothetical protein